MKIVTIIGARPQFIKVATLSRILRQERGVEEIFIHTGQHFDTNMSDVFFEQMNIPKPDYNLQIAGLNHGAMTGRMLEKIEDILLSEKPERVLVYGDTNSTLAGGLAAAKLHIPVAHVEAGLRSFNMTMPEEINRILIDRLSDKLFCPTVMAVKNLQDEGFGNFAHVEIIKSGDIMQDAALYYTSMEQPPEVHKKDVDMESPFALVTLHREENTDDANRLREIFMALVEVSRELPLLMPIHPRTRNKLKSIGFELENVSGRYGNLCFIDPVGYLEMVYLLQRCSIVLTDSGGLQKEAFFFKKPCVTLRYETEWVELLELGVNMLVGSDVQQLGDAINTMLDVVVSDPNGMYGAGKAAPLIVESLLGSR